MRPTIIAGNWKMNLTPTQGAQVGTAIATIVGQTTTPQVILCPPFTHLDRVGSTLKDTAIKLGGQTLHDQDNGAYTGEISATMLTDCGCTHVILGHSERRHLFGETSSMINKKLSTALENGLIPIFCVGETLEERESGQTNAVISKQLSEGLEHLNVTSATQLIIAYEPVWAIGTGTVATPDQAQETHQFIRDQLASILSPPLAISLPILYGGSVKASNWAALYSQSDIDGALIGGASLNAEEFLEIIALSKEATIS